RFRLRSGLASSSRMPLWIPQYFMKSSNLQLRLQHRRLSRVLKFLIERCPARGALCFVNEVEHEQVFQDLECPLSLIRLYLYDLSRICVFVRVRRKSADVPDSV